MEIGILPADVLDIIVQYSEPRPAMALYLSCTYWHLRYGAIFEADRVVVSAHLNEYYGFRYIFELHRGQVKEYKMDHYESALDGHAVPISRVAIGYFSTIRDTLLFIKSIKDILTNNKVDLEGPDVQRFSLSIELGSADRSQLYYTIDHKDQGILIDGRKGLKILEVIERADFVRRSVDKSSLQSLEILVKQYKDNVALTYKSKIHISPQGDVFMKTKIDYYREEVSVRTSSYLYEQMVDIIKYNKHKNNITGIKDDPMVQSLFHVKLTINNAEYYVQDYQLFDSEKVMTNGYKTNAAKRIVKLLASYLYPSKFDENPTLRSNRELPKPQSLAFELCRRVPYPMSNARYMRIDTIDIQIEVGGQTKHIELGLRKHLNIPRKDLLDLLQMMEAQNVHSNSRKKAIPYRMDKHIKGEKPIMMRIDVTTYYSFVSRSAAGVLEKSFVNHLWSLLRKGGYLNYISE